MLAKSFFLSLLVSLTLCELPPAGYLFPLLSQSAAPAGTAYDAKFLRHSTAQVYTITGKTVVISMDPNLPVADFPVVAPKTSDLATEFGSVTPLTADRIDTAFVRSTGHLYLFSGPLVWRFRDLTLWPTATATSGYQLDANYPKKIANEFYGVPDNLFAVVELPNNHIYFFKGDQYYLVRDSVIGGIPTPLPLPIDYVQSCYPKAINTQFTLPAGSVVNAMYSVTSRNLMITVDTGTGWVDATLADKYNMHYFLDRVDPVPTPNPEVKMCVSGDPVPLVNRLPLSYDAIFQRKTGKIYIFKGDEYWRLTAKNFNPQVNDCLDAGYPKKIINNFSVPAGALPTPINAVFQRDNGKIYFFVGTDYYRFSDKYINPEADPTAPDVLDTIVAPVGLTYPQPLSNFGLKVTQYANRNVIGIFQRTNGKIFIFLKERTTGEITYFRVTDKYITGERDDVVDPGWDVSANGLPLASGFSGLTPPFDTVYQRTESDQIIYFHTGNNQQKAFDRFTRLPSVCIACDPTSDGQ